MLHAHVHAAFHVLAACPWCQPMLHVFEMKTWMSNGYVHAACPCCSSMLLVNAGGPCCILIVYSSAYCYFQTQWVIS
jgi:hypothetical protein